MDYRIFDNWKIHFLFRGLILYIEPLTVTVYCVKGSFLSLT